jgi:iron complex outermembrane receptor protein
MIMKKIYIVNIFMMVACSSLYSQTTPPDTTKVVKLNEVIVSAPRTEMKMKQVPASVSVINEDKLTTMAKSIAADEELRLVPGVKVDNGTDGSRVHLYVRGQGVLSESGFRGVQVLIDGIPVNTPGGFCPDLYDVDWQTVKRVEVVKGLAASMYGGGGTGGVVNIITKDGGEKPFNDLFYASAGSYGFWKTMEQIDGTKDNVNYRISYSHMQGNGYREHQAFMGDNLSEKLNWMVSDKVKITQLLTYTNYFNQNSEGMNLARIQGKITDPIQALNTGWQASNNDAVPYNEFHKTQRLTGATTADIKIAKNQNLLLKGYFRMNNYRETSNNGDDYKPYINPGMTAQYNVDFGKENLMNHFSLGADFQSQTITEHEFAVPDEYHRDSIRTDSHFGQQCFDLNSLLINQIIRQRSLGVFLMDKLDISKKLYATLNVRYDYIHSQLDNNIPTPDSLNFAGKKVFENPTYRLGLAYDVCPFINVYANYGTGYLIPTSDELYNNPVSWGGYNSTIKPTTSQGEEIGVRGNVGDNVNFDITGFNVNAKNGFYRFSIPGRGNNTAFFGNRDENKWGAEVYLSYSPVKTINLQVAYTYSHFQYAAHDSVKAHWIPECPQHMLTVEASFKLTKNFTLTLNTEYESNWRLQVDDSIYDTYTIGQTYYQPYMKCSSVVPGFNIYSVNLDYGFKLGTLNGNIGFYAKNIFDQHYYGFTEPNNGVDYNSYQPAPGREFFVSVKLRF